MGYRAIILCVGGFVALLWGIMMFVSDIVNMWGKDIWFTGNTIIAIVVFIAGVVILCSLKWVGLLEPKGKSGVTLDSLHEQLIEISKKVDKIEPALNEFKDNVDQRFDELEERWNKRFEKLEKRVAIIEEKMNNSNDGGVVI